MPLRPIDPRTRLARRAVLGFLATGLALPLLGEAAAPPGPGTGPEAGAEPTADAVLAHPGAYNPFAYARVVQDLWARGRRQQAALWFYVFQIRTRPWAVADQRGDGAGALRGALNEELGSVVNVWVASDLAAWRALAERAIAFEPTFPLSPERPEGLDAAAWQALVTRTRAEYAAEFQKVFAGLSPADFAAKRRQAGLPVGPWDGPGPALPAAWK